VIVRWNQPYDGGSEILYYSVTFLASDGLAYYEETTYCDGKL